MRVGHSLWLACVFVVVAASTGVAFGQAVSRPGHAPSAPQKAYSQLVAEILSTRGELAAGQTSSYKLAEQTVIDAVVGLSGHWLGTRWGLGLPQTREPQVGKINCGTFVGTVLRDAGFNVKVKKLQRQPSQLIIRSFVAGKRVRKFSNKKMEDFLASVREMGPGLFIIGLDFHVGFLVQTDDDLRFIHASFETETVVNEAAATAMPITSSRYRVVGKLLTNKNLESWLRGHKVRVKGSW
jgi:hypothetical protein